MASLGQQEDHPEGELWSSTDVLLYNDELIVLHPATPWFVAIIVHWNLNLFRFLEHGDDKLRLAFCIASGIMSCDPTPGRFLVWDSTTWVWNQLDLVDATIFVLKCLGAGFGATRQHVISMQALHGLGEFVMSNPDTNNNDHDNVNNDFEGPLEDVDLDGFDLLEGVVWEGDLLDDIMVDEQHELGGIAGISLG